MKALSMGEIWDRCLDKIYDRKAFVEGLDALLCDEGAHKILDAACGTGFPALDLLVRGYEIVCSDADVNMLTTFETKKKQVQDQLYTALRTTVDQTALAHLHTRYLELAGMTANKTSWMQIRRSEWEEAFDAVLVRGNSLVYARSWNSTAAFDASLALANIRSSLHALRHLLRPGGFLYVDIFSPDEPLSRDLGPVQIDGNLEQWRWRFAHDWSRQTRTWTLVRENGTGERQEHATHSYLLHPEWLHDLLILAGFRSVDACRVKGEDNYLVFLARTPEIAS